MTRLEKRVCGPCTACCVALEIKTPELRKKRDTPCRHLCATGCGVYEDRPSVCREFLCGWRLFSDLDDGWRPDRSGVLIMRLAPAELPKAWRAAPYGIRLLITGGEAAVRRPTFPRYVARLLGQGIPTFMLAASPAILLNEHLDRDLARDQEGLAERLKALYALLHAARWERGLRMLPALYNLQLDRSRRKIQEKSKA